MELREDVVTLTETTPSAQSKQACSGGLAMSRYKFHSYWEKEYFIAFHEGKAQCVICSKVLSMNSNFTLLF